MSTIAGILGSRVFAGRQLNESQIEQITEALAAAGIGDAREAKAQALEEAAAEFEDNIGINEFENIARRDGKRWTYIHDAWEHQGPYMDWLRSRAQQIREGNA